MKPRNHQHRSLNVSNSRWMAYAVAGFATASGSAISAEGAIHYSGPVDYTFRGKSTVSRHQFPLSHGAHLLGAIAHVTFAHSYYAYFGVDSAKVSNSLRGHPGSLVNSFLVAALPGKSVVSDGTFGPNFYFTTLQDGSCTKPYWLERGTYYIGFRFNTGAGPQYGWVRIHWDGCPANYFIVKDYAWGDPGDKIKTGQRQLHEDETQAAPQAAKKPDAAPVTDCKGSLGLLALGAVGLQAWRKSRRGVNSVAP